MSNLQLFLMHLFIAGCTLAWMFYLTWSPSQFGEDWLEKKRRGK